MAVGDPRKILSLAMQPPSLSTIQESLLSLTETGALSNEPTGNVRSFNSKIEYDGTGKITKLGEVYANLPVDIRIARLIVFGILFIYLFIFIFTFTFTLFLLSLLCIFIFIFPTF